MKSRSVLVFAISIPVACLWVAWMIGERSEAQQLEAPSYEVLEQPSHWVPFSADLRMVQLGHEVETGKFFRNSEGSERIEQYDHNDDLFAILIKNIPQVTFYRWTRGGWAKWAMKLPSEGWHPTNKVLTTRGAKKIPDKLEGLDLYRLEGANGRVDFVAPALNHFAVVVNDSRGRRREHMNIRIGEPPSALFAPPPAAAVVQKPGYNGIVSH